MKSLVRVVAIYLRWRGGGSIPGNIVTGDGTSTANLPPESLASPSFFALPS
jgi:hypothetical protein